MHKTYIHHSFNECASSFSLLHRPALSQLQPSGSSTLATSAGTFICSRIAPADSSSQRPKRTLRRSPGLPFNDMLIGTNTPTVTIPCVPMDSSQSKTLHDIPPIETCWRNLGADPLRPTMVPSVALNHRARLYERPSHARQDSRRHDNWLAAKEKALLIFMREARARTDQMLHEHITRAVITAQNHYLAQREQDLQQYLTTMQFIIHSLQRLPGLPAVQKDHLTWVLQQTPFAGPLPPTPRIPIPASFPVFPNAVPMSTTHDDNPVSWPGACHDTHGNGASSLVMDQSDT